MKNTTGVSTIVEIEQSLKTKRAAYMLFRTEVIDLENIRAIFIPISLKIKLTSKKRNKLLTSDNNPNKNFLKILTNNKILEMKLCWINNVYRVNTEDITSAPIMQPTQIDVEQHLFEIIEDATQFID